MVKNKEAKDAKVKAKKPKKAKGIKIAVKARGGNAFKLPPELGDRLAAAGAELQSRAEAVFAQWLDQASLTLRKSGVQAVVDDIKAAGKQLGKTDARQSFEKMAKTLAATVSSEIAKFAMSATIAKAAARKAAPVKAPKPKAPKPKAAKTVARPVTKPAVKAAKPAAKPAAAKKPVVKTAPKPAAKASATKATAVGNPAPRRRAPRPASRPAGKK